MSLKNLAAVTACVMVGTASAFAGTITIDGSLSDWGITVADDNASMFTVFPRANVLSYFLEDQDDAHGDGEYLGPNQGGQNYDAELMAVAKEGSDLYVAIVTGQRPDNGLQRFAPGDIIIETNAGVYGIEVGGGEGGGDGSAVITGDPGSTYTLQSSGYTVSHAVANVLQTAGSIWGGVNWLLDPINPKEPTQFEIDASSALLGAANYYYTRDTSTTQHAVIELAFDESLFGGETVTAVRWRPACGNDELDVVVPEPASLAFMGLGGAIMGYRRLRR